MSDIKSTSSIRLLSGNKLGRKQPFIAMLVMYSHFWLLKTIMFERGLFNFVYML